MSRGEMSGSRDDRQNSHSTSGCILTVTSTAMDERNVVSQTSVIYFDNRSLLLQTNIDVRLTSLVRIRVRTTDIGNRVTVRVRIRVCVRVIDTCSIAALLMLQLEQNSIIQQLNTVVPVKWKCGFVNF